MVFNYPYHQPLLTFGLPGPVATGQPGGGGTMPDPRALTPATGPWFGGRAVQPLNAWGPNLAVMNMWPQQISNNSYATAILSMYVPGWMKPPGYSGF